MVNHVSGDSFRLVIKTPTGTASAELVISGPEVSTLAATLVDGTATVEQAALDLAAGTYDLYWRFFDADGNKSTDSAGALKVSAAPETLPPSDRADHAEKTLKNIEAVLEGRASNDVMQYSIAGRSLSRIPITELIAWRDALRQEIAAKKAKRLGPGRVNVKI